VNGANARLRARSVSVRAPAKINLFLRIVGRRDDGYHLLDSLMIPIGLYDQLTMQIAPASQPTTPAVVVTSDADAVPDGPANLAHKAAEAFLKAVTRSLAVRIHIEKRIPVGSGLGGGSSDAAAVLLTLNDYLGRPYSPAQLAALGGRIGADVSFFIYGCPARVCGIGEQIAPLGVQTALPLVVCSDGYALSTKLVYSKVSLSLTTPRPDSNITPLVIDPKAISELLVNDLEAAAVQIHAEVLSLKARLMDEGALGALMTGSGSAVFGVFGDATQAQRAATALRRQGLWAEAVETLDMSPAVRG
jgi:4-diphosphocytidyl-2-C-methyl-D-erythritol kinase